MIPVLKQLVIDAHKQLEEYRFDNVEVLEEAVEATEFLVDTVLAAYSVKARGLIKQILAADLRRCEGNRLGYLKQRATSLQRQLHRETTLKDHPWLQEPEESRLEHLVPTLTDEGDA
jgi:hypothetical protein